MIRGLLAEFGIEIARRLHHALALEKLTDGRAADVPELAERVGTRLAYQVGAGIKSSPATRESSTQDISGEQEPGRAGHSRSKPDSGFEWKRSECDLQRMIFQYVTWISPATCLGLGAGETWNAPRTRSTAMHALIIEDESMIAMAIEDALRGCGFSSFDVAVSAEEAVAAAACRCPDLITADVQLRPGCGITAVQTICSERPIPVIFVTGSPSEVKVRMPGHALVEKPFNADHIAAAIELTLDRRGG